VKSKNQNVASFQKKLYSWYERHRRNLPWRENQDPYKIWISEIMLQQTTVQAVIPYYIEWIKLFPDVKSLSLAPLQKVLKSWQGLGYYQRAKNLHKASKIIMDKFNGRIPQDYSELKNLPGFGPYTAGAVLSFAFDIFHPVVDANIRRVSMRLMGLKGRINLKNDRNLLNFLKPFLPQRKTAQFNQVIMELGALVCRPKNPLCLHCPITECRHCDHKKKREVLDSKKTILRPSCRSLGISWRKKKGWRDTETGSLQGNNRGTLSRGKRRDLSYKSLSCIHSIPGVTLCL